MNFKTKEAQDAYMEILEETSSRAAEMYEELDRMELDDKDLFVGRLGIEEYRQNGLSRAIQVGTSVDTQWASVKGGLSLAAFQHGHR